MLWSWWFCKLHSYKTWYDVKNRLHSHWSRLYCFCSNITRVCFLCRIAPATMLFEVAAEVATLAEPISVQVFAIYYSICYYSMLILAIIYRLPFFYDLKERRTKTKAICDVCFALFCIRKSIFCVLTPKFVNWFDQKVVRPDVYPAGPPWKVVRPWPGLAV